MSTYDYEQWVAEMEKQAKSREKNIQVLRETNKHLDEQALRKLDSTMKKVTAFTKKLKNIGSVSATQFLPDLDRLNLNKYLDEIAINICEAKVKTTELNALIGFCVKLASLYAEFPSHLAQQFRKQMPTKKGDKVENPSKLRVDLRFFTELLLNGIFDREGLQLLGSVLSFLVQTDKQEHVNVSVLLPFCRHAFFPITGIPPLQISTSSKENGVAIPKEQLLSKVFSDEQRNVLTKLLNDYWDSLLEHTNTVRNEMNKLRKSIKRQERTRGDASSDDRQRFDSSKQQFERLHQAAIELGELINRSVPETLDEPSDDEREAEAAARRLNKELSEGRVLLWPDRDTQLFYEALLDVTAYTPTAAAQSADAAAAATEQQQKEQQIINESIDNVDLSCLEVKEHEGDGDIAVEEEEEEAEEEAFAIDESNRTHDHEELDQRHSASPMMDGAIGELQQQVQAGASLNFHELLEHLPQCINRELIDAAAIDFLKQYARNKAHRKRLQQHFLQSPTDRLDLLPFYARFLATIRPAYPDIPTHILHELLARFRTISQKNVEVTKKSEKIAAMNRIESKLHLCAYLSELCKFGILPKAEALTCLRSLLVQMRSFKVDMLCMLIEQMGPFLYRSPDAHTKMAVIMQVLRNKSENVKDARQKILLENAYFAVIPPEEQATTESAAHRPPPMQEFIAYKLATEIRVGLFRRIDWDNEEIKEFTLKLLSSPWRVQFEELARLASLVSGLGDYHDWIRVSVLDEILEFLRLSLELNSPRLQQQALSSAAYLGQLFNYNVLYQFISLGIQPLDGSSTEVNTEMLIIRLQRIRLVCQLVDTVCEFFESGKSKRRMDHFLCFFLRFYYETRDYWSQCIEELDEFPDDVEQAVTELLRTWRKGEKFPNSLGESCEKVAEIEQLYKAKVDELLAGMRYAVESREADAEEGQRRLNRIMEENEEMDDEEEEERGEEFDDSEEEDDEDDAVGGRQRHKQKRNSDMSENLEDQLQSEHVDVEEQSQQKQHDFDEEDEQVRVHVRQQQIQPEDEDFMRDFDRLMADSLQSAPVTLKGPMSDLVVPPQAKQKFERKLTFAVTESSQRSTYAETDLLSPIKKYEHRQFIADQSTMAQPQPRMALMLRAQGKGGGTVGSSKAQVLLKPVQIDESENLAEKWRKTKEEQERNRREMKKVTLAMNERMTQEAEELQRKQNIAEMERKLIFNTGSQFGGANDGAFPGGSG